jgi:hypothetical protein
MVHLSFSLRVFSYGVWVPLSSKQSGRPCAEYPQRHHQEQYHRLCQQEGPQTLNKVLHPDPRHAGMPLSTVPTGCVISPIELSITRLLIT